MRINYFIGLVVLFLLSACSSPKTTGKSNEDSSKEGDVATFVMMGYTADCQKAQVWYSDDAKKWQEGSLPANAIYNKAVWVKDRYFAFDPYRSIIIYSYDGKDWEKCQVPEGCKPRGVIYDGKSYVVYTDNRNFSNTVTNYPNPFLISTDGIKFEEFDNQLTTYLHCDAACRGNGLSIFADWDTPILLTKNMEDFEQIDVRVGGRIFGGHFSAQFFKGMFILTSAGNNCVLVSKDAKQWDRVTLPPALFDPLCVLVGKNEAVITNVKGRSFAKSTDGYHWEEFAAPMVSNGYDGISVDGKWYFRDNDDSGAVYLSKDLTHFEKIGNVPNMQCEKICAFASCKEDAQRY